MQSTELSLVFYKLLLLLVKKFLSMTSVITRSCSKKLNLVHMNNLESFNYFNLDSKDPQICCYYFDVDFCTQKFWNFVLNLKI